MRKFLVLMLVAVSSVALFAAVAQAGSGATAAQNPNCPAGTSNPSYCGPPPSPKAPGFYCNQQHASKKHVKGEKGTEFSRCVHALNAMRKNDNLSARKACTKAKAPKSKHKGSKKTGF